MSLLKEDPLDFPPPIITRVVEGACGRVLNDMFSAKQSVTRGGPLYPTLLLRCF